MKATIHPQWFDEAKVTCACGNAFVVGAAVPAIHVDVCSNCHPFYTGQMKYVDTAGRVDAFKQRQTQATKKVVSKAQKRQLKREKRINEELDRPDTLAEVRLQAKDKKGKKKSKKS